MNYTELRVGNHVYINGRQTLVSAADLLALSQAGRFSIPEDAVCPIFLSENLLLKLGFKVEFDVTPSCVYSLGDFLLRSNAGHTFHLYVGQQVVGRPVAYLHQLQNLFFLLQGRELMADASNGVGSGLAPSSVGISDCAL